MRSNVKLTQFPKPCKNEGNLRNWLDSYLKLKFPESGVCPGHCSPFEYLKSAYFEPATDLVVWAPRGGGKTRLGAVATLLDLAHKPGISVRILGGSLEQSMKMWEHLQHDVDLYLQEKLDGKIGARGFRLSTGSRIAVLAQSERAVRGLRVQKLRCDEVEMFHPDVWQAAQFVTKSTPSSVKPFPEYRGVVEAFSTVHEVGGLMENIIERAKADGTRILQWCLMEILQHCPPERDCDTCPLLQDCQKRAKTQCNGFLSIDDAIAIKRRSSREAWEAEMLCLRPSRRDRVFKHFNEEIHVRESLPVPPLYGLQNPKLEGLYLGVDFGFRNPFVCLWIRRDSFGRSLVIDEYVQNEVEIDRHVQELLEGQKARGKVRKVGCDPSGSARNEQTGISNVQKLREAQFKVSCKGSRIADGLEIIRTGLCTGTGEATLFIHPRCKRLIQAMRAYRYGEGRTEEPLKDGHDHLIDALRYYFINRDSGEVEVGVY